MRLIVDANIVFSGILNSKGKIGDLLINSRKYLEFIAPNFLHEEIFKHYSRLCKISGLTSEQVRESEFQVCKDITFISEEQIRLSTWIESEKLVADNQEIKPLIKRLKRYLLALTETPYIGEGKQEELKYQYRGYWKGESIKKIGSFIVWRRKLLLFLLFLL